MRKLFQAVAFGCTLACTLSAHAGFDFDSVVNKAKDLASKPYKAPETIPKFMQDLSFSDYQNIRFNPDKSLWQETHSRFQVMFFSPGLFYRNPVAMNVIDAEGVHSIDYRKSYFTFTDPELEKRVPADLGFAGFKLTYPLIKSTVQDQFLVFAGASYFRGVGRNNAWGISARGVAVDTGLPTGEEFPSFIEYWMVRPAPDATAMTFYGLLDGKSLSGAYEFQVYPGPTTQVRVKAVLFPRDQIDLLGVAPLTSMFYYGTNTSRPQGEWRSQVHDSDGLLLQNGSTGEWLWRPLINPKTLQMDYFLTDNVRGFGLLQRDVEFADYQDLGAHYEKRPSTWVEPQGDWGKGNIVLVQLPSPNETNDNIVAFWSPTQKVTSKDPINLSYNLNFGLSDLANEPMGQAIQTFVGDGNRIGGGTQKGAYRLIVDFAGGPLDKLSPRTAVEGTVTALNDGELIEQFVEYNEPLHCWRLSMLARPAKDKPLELRAFLHQGGKPLSETWTYRLPADNDIVPEGD